jgi:hypothetical protein
VLVNLCRTLVERKVDGTNINVFAYRFFTSSGKFPLGDCKIVDTNANVGKTLWLTCSQHLFFAAAHHQQADSQHKK